MLRRFQVPHPPEGILSVLSPIFIDVNCSTSDSAAVYLAFSFQASWVSRTIQHHNDEVRDYFPICNLALSRGDRHRSSVATVLPTHGIDLNHHKQSYLDTCSCIEAVYMISGRFTAVRVIDKVLANAALNDECVGKDISRSFLTVDCLQCIQQYFF